MGRWILVLLLATTALSGCVQEDAPEEDPATAAGDAQGGQEQGSLADTTTGALDTPEVDVDLPDVDAVTDDAVDVIDTLLRPDHAAPDLRALDDAGVLLDPAFAALDEALQGAAGYLGMAPDLSGDADAVVAFEGEAPDTFILLLGDLSVRLLENADVERLSSPVSQVHDIAQEQAEGEGILPLPEDSVGIGPGSPLLVSIPDEGKILCTAAHVFSHEGAYYLAAAGHCFLPADRTATHGSGADYDASGVTVEVCVDFCFFGGYLAGFWGSMEGLGPVAYARQTGPGGDVGNDFGLVEIPAPLLPMVRAEMPMWGGPTGEDSGTHPGDPLVHYGNGIYTGSSTVSKARAGSGLGDDGPGWQANVLVSKGDSGSAIHHAGWSTDDTLTAGEALGLITHGLAVPGAPLGWGTTFGQAVGMAEEAGLQLSLVPAGQDVQP